MRTFRLFLCLVTSITAHAAAGPSPPEPPGPTSHPPPGFPTGGHGPRRRDRPRLLDTPPRSPRFYFRDPHGASLVPRLLRPLRDSPCPCIPRSGSGSPPEARAGPSIPRTSSSARPTRTKAPGNYLTTEVYNQFGSKYSGFSRPALRIPRGANRWRHFPTRSPIGNRPQLNLRSGLVREPFVVNRSPLPFMLNWDRPQRAG